MIWKREEGNATDACDISYINYIISVTSWWRYFPSILISCSYWVLLNCAFLKIYLTSVSAAFRILRQHGESGRRPTTSAIGARQWGLVKTPHGRLGCSSGHRLGPARRLTETHVLSHVGLKDGETPAPTSAPLKRTSVRNEDSLCNKLDNTQELQLIGH